MIDVGRPARASRPDRLAWLLLCPAILAAGVVVALEVWRGISPDSPLFTRPAPRTLAAAIEGGDVAGAYAFLRAGQDPSSLIAVRHPVLTDGRDVLASPLVWAVALRQPDAALMLIGFGARMDRAADAHAACLADALGDVRLAHLLRRYGGQPPSPCGPVPSGGAALTAFLARWG